MLDTECREAEKKATRPSAATGATTEILGPSPGRCEAMLKILGRDDTLRRIYVRRRWQGLGTSERKGE